MELRQFFAAGGVTLQVDSNSGGAYLMANFKYGESFESFNGFLATGQYLD